LKLKSVSRSKRTCATQDASPFERTSLIDSTDAVRTKLFSGRRAAGFPQPASANAIPSKVSLLTPTPTHWYPGLAILIINTIRSLRWFQISKKRVSMRPVMRRSVPKFAKILARVSARREVFTTISPSSAVEVRLKEIFLGEETYSGRFGG
jgi:hypothetical protein